MLIFSILARLNFRAFLTVSMPPERSFIIKQLMLILCTLKTLVTGFSLGQELAKEDIKPLQSHDDIQGNTNEICCMFVGLV